MIGADSQTAAGAVVGTRGAGWLYGYGHGNGQPLGSRTASGWRLSDSETVVLALLALGRRETGGGA